MYGRKRKGDALVLWRKDGEQMQMARRSDVSRSGSEASGQHAASICIPPDHTNLFSLSRATMSHSKRIPGTLVKGGAY